MPSSAPFPVPSIYPTSPRAEPTNFTQAANQIPFAPVLSLATIRALGVWLSLARALRSGRRGRRFKSFHPDLISC